MILEGIRGGSKAPATSKMERFVIIVNGFQPLTIITKLPAVNYYHKALHLGCCSHPRSAAGNKFAQICLILEAKFDHARSFEET